MDIIGYNTEVMGLDVQWLSNYTEESEILLFEIRKLIDDPVTQKIDKLTLQMFDAVLKGTVQDLITSPYIQKLLMYQINNPPVQIVYDYDILLKDFRGIYQFIKIVGEEYVLRINMFCNIFLHCSHITFTMNDRIGTLDPFWNSVVGDILLIDRTLTVTFEWDEGKGAAIARNTYDTLSRIGIEVDFEFNERNERVIFKRIHVACHEHLQYNQTTNNTVWRPQDEEVEHCEFSFFNCLECTDDTLQHFYPPRKRS